MVKAGFPEGTEVGLANQPVPAAETANHWPTPVRPPGSRAVLVSSRSAVWDQPAPPLEGEDEVSRLSDPIWDHHNGTRWTPDLVHCRLLDMGDTFNRLPRVMLKGFTGLLGLVVLDDDAEPRVRPDRPSAAAISLADWTFRQVMTLPETERAICVCSAMGWGVRKIGKRVGLGKSAVHSRYIAERRSLAARWQGMKQPVDALAFARWRDVFENATK
jgi:hypothetical protein